MHVIATAGHVDHGKSTLVRALTGMEPDRWAEERRRGMTIDLGYAWTTLASGERLAFVDVPGHERFVTNMLAGVGPAPVVMLVVAADEGWMPQTEEHVQAARLLGTRPPLVVITKCDLAPPDAVLAEARARLREHGWHDVPHATVSATTGDGLGDLRASLDAVIAGMPPARVDGPVRLWIDRAFTIRGAGTVVTGTLTSGRISVGEQLQLAPDGRAVAVRGLQSLNEDVPTMPAVARVAVNLRSVAREDARRGEALVTPDAWTIAAELDAVTDGAVRLPEQVVVHIGSAAVPARVRRLAETAVRLRLARPLPLHLGDRLLLRDPASRSVGAADVADLSPLPLRRRGDALRLASSLAVPTTADEELARHPICTSRELRARGLADQPRDAVAVADNWIAGATWERLGGAVTERTRSAGPLDGIPLPVLARDLDISTDIAAALVAATSGLRVVDGRVTAGVSTPVEIPGLAELLARLDREPFDPPGAATLAALGLTPVALAHAVRERLLVRIADGLYLAPAAIERALELLHALDQPFTVADARTALGSTRRVVVPLLEHLDATRRTRRQLDGTRFIVVRQA